MRKTHFEEEKNINELLEASEKSLFAVTQVFIKNKFFYITINRGDNTFDYVNYNGCISFLLLDYNNKNDKLDLCETIAIMNLRFSYPVL